MANYIFPVSHTVKRDSRLRRERDLPSASEITAFSGNEIRGMTANKNAPQGVFLSHQLLLTELQRIQLIIPSFGGEKGLMVALLYNLPV